jgi:hypothetical protein
MCLGAPKKYRSKGEEVDILGMVKIVEKLREMC